MTATDPTSGAGYAFGEVLPSADMTTIATQQPDVLDATNGGSWTLGTAITWTLAANVTVSVPYPKSWLFTTASGPGAIGIDSNVALAILSGGAFQTDSGSSVQFSAGSTITDAGTWTTTGAHTISGNTTISGGIWQFGVGAGTLTAESGAGKWTLNNDVELANTTTLSGGTSVTAPATLSGSGQVVWRYHVAADSGSQTFTANQYDEIDCSAQSAPHSWSLTNTGAVTGSRIRFVNAPANAVTLTVTTLGSVVLKSNTTGNYLWIEFVFDGTQWQRSIYDQIP